jgi:hypothetical protein
MQSQLLIETSSFNYNLPSSEPFRIDVNSFPMYWTIDVVFLHGNFLIIMNVSRVDKMRKFSVFSLLLSFPECE